VSRPSSPAAALVAATLPGLSSRARRPVTVAAGALAAALVLAGCASGGDSVTDPPADTSAYPVVQIGQAGSVLDAVQTALDNGVSTTTPVDARLVGPFRQLALAQAKEADQRKAKLPKAAAMTSSRLIVPVGHDWPRFFVAVGAQSDAATPVIRVMDSSAARAPYGLWAEAPMLPGATLPETASATNGSPLVDANESGLVAVPADVASSFATYLNDGAKTTTARPFTRSVFSDQLTAQLTKDQKALKPVATVSSTQSTVSGSPTLAIRTQDGGALVVAELTQKYVVTVKKGKGTVKVSDKSLAALAGGKTQFSKSFTRTALEVVVFDVPERGQGRISVVAVQKGDISAALK
jgi:hypothetical protein